jgi:hypothetical protein
MRPNPLEAPVTIQVFELLICISFRTAMRKLALGGDIYLRLSHIYACDVPLRRQA